MATKRSDQRASWDGAKDAFLVEAMVQRTLAGKRVGSGWKKEAWRAATAALNAHFGVLYDYRQLKSKLAELKKKYKLLHSLKNNSESGWDDTLKLPTASNSVWNDLIQTKPDLQAFRTAPFPLYTSLHQPFDGLVATGMLGASTGPDQLLDVPDPQQRSPFTLSSYLPSSDSEESTASPTHPAPKASKKRQASELAPVQARRGSRLSVGKEVKSILEKMYSQPKLEHKSALAHKSKQEQAGEIIATEFEEELSPIEMADAFDVVLHEGKAAIFCVMKRGEARTIWLRRQIEKAGVQ